MTTSTGKQKIEITQISQKGIDFISTEEGCVLHPYLDSKGIPTIGIGCTYYPGGIKVTMKDHPITKEMAYKLFKTVLATYEKTVWSVTRDDINQNQFDSLVSLCYNIGVAGFKRSELLSLVNKNPNPDDRIEITEAFKNWRYAGGKPILLGRRKREAIFYFS
jgi:lysozyme